MGQLKGYQVDEWLARKSSVTPVVLIYGADRGLVSERARCYAAKCDVALDDPFSVVRLDAIELEKQPARLEDEASTISMFAGRRLIWIRNASAQKALSEALKRLCASPPANTLILVEAGGDLKKNVAIRAAIEASPNALALPCYPDTDQEIGMLIDAELEKEGLSIEPEARLILMTSLGGDRLATRSELQKLLLSAMGSRKITLADVRSLTGDTAAHSSDDVIDAMLSGDLGGFDNNFSAHVRSIQVQGLLLAAQRQLQLLHQLRATMDREGRSAPAVVAGAKPPIFFSRQKFFESALQRWDTTTLAEILAVVQETIFQTRRCPDLAFAVSYQTLLGITISRPRSAKGTGQYG